jgi:ADP-ribose pyrophosphatase
MKKETKVLSKQLYSNFFVEVFIDDIKNVHGDDSKRFYINHKGAVGILPITKDGHVLLVEQYRYAIQKHIIEVPAGLKDKSSETSMEAVMREFKEETGYFSESIHYVGNFYVSVGYSNELIDLYIAYDCYEIEDKPKQDADENIVVHKIPLLKAKDMLNKFEIKDSKAIILLQHYFLNGVIK